MPEIKMGIGCGGCRETKEMSTDDAIFVCPDCFKLIKGSGEPVDTYELKQAIERTLATREPGP